MNETEDNQQASSFEFEFANRFPQAQEKYRKGEYAEAAVICNELMSVAESDIENHRIDVRNSLELCKQLDSLFRLLGEISHDRATVSAGSDPVSLSRYSDGELAAYQQRLGRLRIAQDYLHLVNSLENDAADKVAALSLWNRKYNQEPKEAGELTSSYERYISNVFTRLISAHRKLSKGELLDVANVWASRPTAGPSVKAAQRFMQTTNQFAAMGGANPHTFTTIENLQERMRLVELAQSELEEVSGAFPIVALQAEILSQTGSFLRFFIERPGKWAIKDGKPVFDESLSESELQVVNAIALKLTELSQRKIVPG
jgi:hypothetical protein